MDIKSSPLRLILALAGIVTFHASSSLAAVPNVFSSGDPVVADEVNQNFSDIDSRVTGLENSAATTPNFSGYGMPFSADGADKNVVVQTRQLGNGNTVYNVRSRYATSTEQISINGVLTQRPFIANYVYVEVDGGGNLVFVSNYIEAPDTENYVVFNVEQTDFDVVTLNKTVTADNLKEDWLCGGGAASVCVVTVTLSSDGSYVNTYSWSSIRAISGPITVNGMVFNDVRIEELVNRDTVRVRAKGIGEVLRSNTQSDPTADRRVLYYRVNGMTGGSLAGTPFEAGQPLDGLFF